MKFDLQSAWFKREQAELQRQMILTIWCGTARDLADMIDRGADVNTPDPQIIGKVYPLAIAIRQNKPEMVHTLLAAAANPLHRHQIGRETISMSELARRHKNEMIIEMVTLAEQKARRRQDFAQSKNKGQEF